VFPHKKKRTETLPLPGRLSSCALSVQFYSAACQDRPVLCVQLCHASDGQSCIRGYARHVASVSQQFSEVMTLPQSGRLDGGEQPQGLPGDVLIQLMP
jgi:hypothetical protein